MFRAPSHFLLGPIAAGLLLAGCSVTQFEEPITSFQSAAADSKTALEAASNDLTAQYKADMEKRALGYGTGWNVRLDGCASCSDFCRVVLLPTGQSTPEAMCDGVKTIGEAESTDPVDVRVKKIADEIGKQRIAAFGTKEVYPPAPIFENSLEVMTSIEAYAAGLLKIVKADTVGEIETQTNAVKGSIETIVEKVESTPGVPKGLVSAAGTANNFVAPTIDAINYLVGLYVETVKRKALKDATATAVEPVNKAAEIFEAETRLALTAPKVAQVALVDRAFDTFMNDRTSKASFNALVTQAGALNDLMTAESAQTFTAMATAHQKMVAAIKDDSVSLPDMFAAISAFVTKAKELKDAFEQAAEASSQAAEG